MIRHAARAPRCLVCNKLAVRVCLDRPGRNGQRREIHLCDSCPSPEEIDARARRIALSWSPTEMACRVYGCCSDQVGYHTAVYYDKRVFHLVSDE